VYELCFLSEAPFRCYTYRCTFIWIHWTTVSLYLPQTEKFGRFHLKQDPKSFAAARLERSPLTPVQRVPLCALLPRFRPECSRG